MDWELRDSGKSSIYICPFTYNTRLVGSEFSGRLGFNAKLNCIGIQVISTMEGALSVTVRLVKKKSYWYKINPVYKLKTLQIFGPIGSSPDNKQINKYKAAALMKLI